MPGVPQRLCRGLPYLDLRVVQQDGCDVIECGGVIGGSRVPGMPQCGRRPRGLSGRSTMGLWPACRQSLPRGDSGSRTNGINLAFHGVQQGQVGQIHPFGNPARPRRGARRTSDGPVESSLSSAGVAEGIRASTC
ncbi:MAG: hypothetical protein MZV64_23305 [Ignavibacteriales bacterium]|nr:hypothetical protein [Ignavibacteriales bacterium]